MPGPAAALAALAAALVGRVEPDEVADRLVDLALATCPAERAALLVPGAEPGDLRVAASRDRPDRAGTAPPVSRTLAARVLAARRAVLCRDVLADPEVGGIASVRAARIRALVAAPLVVAGEAVGLLYLDTVDGPGPDEPAFRRLVELLPLAAAGLAPAARGERRAASGAPAAGLASLERPLIGRSPAMLDLIDKVRRVAATDSTVLLRGETGTGKELVARAIHANSRRARGPFVAVNCAAVPDTLLESELFGHERGAFTGAVSRRLGRFAAAAGGTLFLDEVGELSLAAQARLLRAIEERAIDPLGATRPVPIDVRVIAATHRDLEAARREGRFRDDLFHRLAVVALRLPALRERREDVPLLARHFLAQVRVRLDRPALSLGDSALACLERYDWPGNVRELANAIERAAVLGSSDTIAPEDLPESVVEGGRGGGPAAALSGYHEGVLEAKRALVRAALSESAGNVTAAARRLGVHPNYLHRLMNGLGLRG